ncbi:hypothetical protein ACFFGH_06230 [Lysobacter korlensis]|uniref:DUF2007 domain-containing protein n=1 Tax=Lysobacter korlensis TaxID=553636 RepID=A0ABV6RKD8_9GAMM
MRQIFSSPRLENVEKVAQLMRDADIQVRITDGRSYKGSRRGGFSYSDTDAPKPAVWIVRSEDQVRAREILRTAGLIDSTRTNDGSAPTFRFEPRTQQAAADPGRKRAFRFKVAVLGGIAVVIGMALVQTVRTPLAPVLASPPFDGSVHATLPAVAIAAFQHAVADAKLPVLCLTIDGRDAPAAVIDQVGRQPFITVPGSHCRRVADSDTGSVFPKTGQPALLIDVQGFRPSAADTAKIEVNAYHHQMYGSYKTLQVRHIDGRWQVTDTLRHVAMQG